MCTNNHAASRRLVFGAGLVALLMLLVMLLPAATARHDQDEALPDAAAASSLLAHELHPADPLLPVDELPGREPRKPASKPCKRISQIAKSLLEKPQLVQIALLTLISPPANQPVLAVFATPDFPLDSSLVRRSGLTLAPPLFA